MADQIVTLLVGVVVSLFIWKTLDWWVQRDEAEREQDKIYLIEVPPLEHQGKAWLADVGLKDHVVVVPDPVYKNVLHIRRRTGAWIE